MQKRKNLFRRIPLEEVPRLLREQRIPGSSEYQSEDLEIANDVPTTSRPHPENAQKRTLPGKHSLRTEEGDRSVGLWINKDMFRRHQHQQAQIVLHDPRPGTNTRYLALADLALNNRKRASKNTNNVNAKTRIE
jgi:hypothetical protein